MTDADKVKNPLRLRHHRIRIRINPEIRIRISDHRWLRLDSLAEVYALWTQCSSFELLTDDWKTGAKDGEIVSNDVTPCFRLHRDVSDRVDWLHPIHQLGAERRVLPHQQVELHRWWGGEDLCRRCSVRDGRDVESHWVLYALLDEDRSMSAVQLLHVSDVTNDEMCSLQLPA